MAENEERRSFISDLVEINEDTQENDVPISKNDDDKPDRETDCDEEKHVVSDLIEEDRFTDLTTLISSKHNLPNKEHSLICEKRSAPQEMGTLFLQQEVNFHVFHDPMANLLQSVVKVIIAAFSDEGDHGQLCFWRPSYQYLLLTRRSDPENQSRGHLLDWLHWKTHYT